tara:strand:+ start:3714 stop:4667 length:954 start_codon:yes stop_codon:yes gene_type:complete
MTTLCFYNHYHNGDLFVSKGFVNYICKQLHDKNITLEYLHENHPNVLADLPTQYQALSSDPIMSLHSTRLQKVFVNNNKIYVNTWAGPYLSEYTQDQVVLGIGGSINYLSYLDIFKHIINELNNITSWNLTQLSAPWQGLPEVQKISYNSLAVTDFILRTDFPLRVLISNGPVLCDQSWHNHNMIDYFLPIIEKNASIQWIFTWPTGIQYPNVAHTNDIFLQQGSRCDLNEISMLSEYCDFIIGRHSGPFHFCNTKTNLQNPNKTFISIGKHVGHAFPYQMSIPAKFYWLEDRNDSAVKFFIETLLVNSLIFHKPIT